MRNKWVIFLLLIISISPFITASGIWDGQRRFTVVLQTDNTSSSSFQMGVFSIEPRTNRAVYLKIPQNTFLQIPYGYKTYLASSIYRLGEMDKARGGGILLSKSIEATFGIIVEGFLLFGKGNLTIFPQTEAQLSEIKNNFFSFHSLIKVLGKSQDVSSSLSFFDNFRLWNAIRKLRIDKFAFIDLMDTTLLKEEILPDGSIVLNIDKDLFDVTVKDQFEDSLIRKEMQTIEVVNATGEDLQATYFSRLLEHLGADVIIKKTASKVEEKSCLFYLGDGLSDKSYLIERLERVFGCQKKNERGENLQTDIRIIIGKEFVK